MSLSSTIAPPEAGLRGYRVRVEQAGDEIVIVRRECLGAAIGLIIWLAGWTAACVTIGCVIAREPTFEHILFATQFFASWVLVSGFLLYLAFGFERLRVGPAGLEHRRGLGGVPLTRRRVPLEEVKGVTRASKPLTAGDTPETGSWLRIATLGRPVEFGGSAVWESGHGSGLVTPDRVWLTELVERHLEALAPGRDFSPRAALAEAKVTDPPSDSRLRVRRDWDRDEYLRTFPFDLAAFGQLTFINLFWNGIVGIFLHEIVAGKIPWPVFLFLSVHLALGALMLLAWVQSILAPFYRRTWVLQPGAITSCWSLFGAGRARSIEAADLAQVDFRRRSRPARPAAWNLRGDEPRYEVGLVDGSRRDRLVIRDLTEGEARWLAGEFSEWLKGPRALGGGPGSTGPAGLWDRWIDGSSS